MKKKSKVKPLTLLDGSNLLHILVSRQLHSVVSNRLQLFEIAQSLRIDTTLEQHGTHAKIDLREAKRILKETSTMKT
jgi:hypothetical protein